MVGAVSHPQATVGLPLHADFRGSFMHVIEVTYWCFIHGAREGRERGRGHGVTQHAVDRPGGRWVAPPECVPVGRRAGSLSVGGAML